MAELSEYDIQQINRIISNFSNSYNTLSRLIERSSVDSDISSGQSSIDRYLRDASDAKNKASSYIKNAMEGSGIFFRTNGFNDVIKERVKAGAEEATKIVNTFQSEAAAIIKSIGSIDSVLSSGTIFNASEYDESQQYSFFTADNQLKKPQQTQQTEPSDGNILQDGKCFDEEQSTLAGIILPIVTRESVNVSTKQVVEGAITSQNEQIVDSISSILDADEISGEKKTNIEKKQQPSKRVVVSKNTHLDNDDIKQVFLSRHLDYDITLDELNKAIAVVGNDLDKDAIIFEAMKIKFYTYLPSFEYFKCFTTIRKAIDIALKLEKYETAFDMLCGMIFLETSGYIMAQANYRERRSIDETNIDPRITSYVFEKIKANLNKSSLEIESIFTQSVYVRELYASMPKPYFTIENSSKLMMMAYKEPYEFLSCKNIDVPYNK